MFPLGVGGGGVQHLLLDGLVSYLREDDSGMLTPMPKVDYANALSMLQPFMSKSWHHDLYLNYIVCRNEGEIVAVIQALAKRVQIFTVVDMRAVKCTRMYEVVSYQLARLDYLTRLGTVVLRITTTRGFRAFFPPEICFNIVCACRVMELFCCVDDDLSALYKYVFYLTNIVFNFLSSSLSIKVTHLTDRP